MSLLSVIGSYEEAWKAIIMPPRQDYSMHDLGTTEFFVEETRIQRTDFRLLNKRGQTIECSFFQPAELKEAIPCVVYLHANGCCRLEVMSYLEVVLSNPVSLFCFDFTGCGKSGGQYTSVGWFEQDDLECVIQYLCNTGKVTKIAVWGRSMGAVTSLLYSGKDPRISCLILDSPFAKFKQLVKELAKDKANIPGFLTEGAFSIIRSTIKKKANFDLEDLRPIKHVDKIKIPALFGAAKEDNFVSPQHTRDLYMGYGGQKQLMIFEGDHNSQRPFNWMQLVKEFLKAHLLGEKNESQPFKQVYNPAENSLQETSDDKDRQNTKASNEISPHPLPYNKSFTNMHLSWLEHSASTPDLSQNELPKLAGLSERSMSGQDQNDTSTESKSATRRLLDLFLNDKKKKAMAESQTLQKSATIDLTKQILEGGKLQATQRINDENDPNATMKSRGEVPTSGRLNRPNSSSISIFGPKKSKLQTEDFFQSPVFDLSKSTDKSLKEISSNTQKPEETKKSYLKGYHEFHTNSSDQPNTVPHKPVKSKSINFQDGSTTAQTARPFQRSQTHQFEVQKQLAKKENISPQKIQKPAPNTSRPLGGQFVSVHLNSNVFASKTNEARQMDIRRSSDHIMKIYPVMSENDHENQVKFSNRGAQNTERLKTSGSVLHNSNTSTKKYTFDISNKNTQNELLKMQGIVK